MSKAILDLIEQIKHEKKRYKKLQYLAAAGLHREFALNHKMDAIKKVCKNGVYGNITRDILGIIDD